MSKGGVFTARIGGIYPVLAIATVNGTLLKTVSAKVSVVTQYDDLRQ